jgi:hypothetical protein
MHFKLNTFCGHVHYLSHFLSHHKTPKDKITSICLILHSLRVYVNEHPDNNTCASIRASIKALSNLKEVSILVGYDERWTRQKYSAAEVEHFKRLFGFDSDGVVLNTPRLPEDSTQETVLNESI